MQRRPDSDTHVHILQGVLHNTPTQLDSNLYTLREAPWCRSTLCAHHPSRSLLLACGCIRWSQVKIRRKLNWIETGLSNTPVVRVHHVATLCLLSQVAKVIWYLQQIVFVPSIIYNILKDETRGTIVVGMMMLIFWHMSADDYVWFHTLDFRL